MASPDDDEIRHHRLLVDSSNDDANAPIQQPDPTVNDGGVGGGINLLISRSCGHWERGLVEFRIECGTSQSLSLKSVMQFSVGMLWLASALLLSPINAASSASFTTTTIDHHQSSRRLLPIARNQLNFMNDVANPLQLANRNLRRADDPAIQALLQRARPYKQNLHRRKLDDVQFDGSYSLKFSQCLDVQTYNEDLFDQDILEYSSSGKVVSVKSYVLFYVCQTNVNCDYDADDVDLYLVDLQTYLSSAAKYRANIRVDYCEACDEFEDYCNPQQEEGGEEDANEDADAAAADEEEEVEEAAAEEEEDEPEQEDAEEEEPDGEQEENPEGEGEEGLYTAAHYFYLHSLPPVYDSTQLYL